MKVLVEYHSGDQTKIWSRDDIKSVWRNGGKLEFQGRNGEYVFSMSQVIRYEKEETTSEESDSSE